MKYSQAVLVAVVGGAALAAAAPASTAGSDVAPVAREVEEFFERAFDEDLAIRDVETNLEARDGLFAGFLKIFTPNADGGHKHSKQGHHGHTHGHTHKHAPSPVASFAAPNPSAKAATPQASAPPVPETATPSVPETATPPVPASEKLSSREINDELDARGWIDRYRAYRAASLQEKANKAASKVRGSAPQDPGLPTEQRRSLLDEEDLSERDFDELFERELEDELEARGRLKDLIGAVFTPSSAQAQASALAPVMRSFDEEDLMERDLYDEDDLLERDFYDEEDILERDLYDEEDVLERDLYDDDVLERDLYDEEDLFAREYNPDYLELRNVLDALQAVEKTVATREFDDELDLRGFEDFELDELD